MFVVLVVLVGNSRMTSRAQGSLEILLLTSTAEQEQASTTIRPTSPALPHKCCKDSRRPSPCSSATSPGAGTGSSENSLIGSCLSHKTGPWKATTPQGTACNPLDCH